MNTTNTTTKTDYGVEIPASAPGGKATALVAISEAESIADIADLRREFPKARRFTRTIQTIVTITYHDEEGQK